jgi:TonB family protein
VHTAHVRIIQVIVMLMALACRQTPSSDGTPRDSTSGRLLLDDPRCRGVRHISGGKASATKMTGAGPDYKDCAGKIEGNPVVEAMIGPDGVPRNLRIVTSGGACADVASIAAVRQWRFCPAIDVSTGRAVEMTMQFTMR